MKEWQHTRNSNSNVYQVVQLVIDVPKDAAYISYGLWMKGNGKCCMRNPRFEIVDRTVPLTTEKIYDRVAQDRWIERVARA